MPELQDPVCPESADPARVRELFEEAIELPRDQRVAYLDSQGANACERQFVERLICADSKTAVALDFSVTQWIDRLNTDPADARSMIGQMMGPYRIVELLGQGGSAIVFKATRLIDTVEQTVAVKVLHSGLFSIEARRRFRAEQLILTRLSHPNIAQLIDAGISVGGIPFIAIEHVQGIDLLSYAQQHTLSIGDRLRLLADLCRAVDAAHRVQIIHRDLKPSNVMVSQDGHIKVLDFGIAKFLDDGEGATATQHIALTPGYAAPEQFRPGSLTPSVDVYALGVLASELLIGRRLGADASWPADRAASSDSHRIRWRKLNPELVDILHATLASEPHRRYATAGHLADDIDRYLAREPLAVRPLSVAYRLRKFVARHRGSVAASVLLMTSIAAGMGVSIFEALAARREAAKASAELGRANALRDFMFDAFAEAEPTVPRAHPLTVNEVAERAISKALDGPVGNARVRIELVTRLCGVLSAQGKFRRAGEILKRNSDEAQKVLGSNDPLTLEAARAYAWNGVMLGDFAIARQQFDALLESSRGEATEIRIRVLLDSASLASKVQARERARNEAQEAVDLAGTTGNEASLGLALESFANVLLATGAARQSIPIYENALQLAQQKFGPAHVAVAALHASLARAYRHTGDTRRAEDSARSAIAIDRAMYVSPDWHTATHLNALTIALKSRRDFKGALASESEALRLFRLSLGDDHPESVNAMSNVGALLFLDEDFEAAIPILQEALRRTLSQFGPGHRETAVVRANYGFALARSGQLLQGENEIQAALDVFAALSEVDPDDFAAALEKGARAALYRGEPTLAIQRLERMHSVLASLQDGDGYWDGRVETLRGYALLELERLPEAELALEAGRLALANSAQADASLRIENTLVRAAAAEHLGQSGRRDRLMHDARADLKALLNPSHRLQSMAMSLALRW